MMRDPATFPSRALNGSFRDRNPGTAASLPKMPLLSTVFSAMTISADGGDVYQPEERKE